MSLSGFLVTSAAARLIGWTLVHFLWEGILIAAVLALLLEWARDKSPELRYAMTLVSMLLLPLVPLVTAISTQRNDLSASPVAYLDSNALKKAGFATNLSHASSPNEAIIIAVLRDASRQTGALLEGRNSVRDAVQSALPIIVSLWLIGVLLFSVRFVRSMAAVRRLLITATVPCIDRFEEMADRLCRRLNISTPVKIMQSAMVQVPTVAGMARPVILLPLSALTGLPQDELEMIIAHELAHIKRHDFLVNVLQNLLETLFFFHPAMWWISGRLRVERELCCDDMAVSVSGDPIRYARALADLEELRAHPQPALAANGGDLLFRIRRILGVEISPRDSASFLVAGSVISFLALAALAPLAVMAMPVAPRPPVAPQPPRVMSPWVSVSSPLPPATPSATITVEAKRDTAEASVPSDDFAGATILDSDFGITIPAVPATPAPPPPAPASPPAEPLHNLVLSVPAVTVRLAAPPAPAAAIAPLLPMAVARVMDRVRAVVPVTARRAIVTLPAMVVARTPAPARLARVRFLETHDVQATPEYVQEMRDEGYQLSEEDASTMSSLGISRDFIEKMKEAGLSDLSAENLIGLKAVGVTPDFIARMRSAGLDDLTTENLIALRSLGVTEDLVRSMSTAGFTDLSAGDLVSLKAVGITSPFIDAMKRADIGDLDIEDLVALKSVGVNGDVITGFRRAGLDQLSAEDVIGLQSLRVTPEYIGRLKDLGYTSLSADELLQLKAVGVTTNFIEGMKRQGHDDLSIDDLIEAWSKSLSRRNR